MLPGRPFAITMELISLPVSLGEAMDKLSILEIKMQKISDSRRADCEKEYDLLAERLDPYRYRFAYYCRLLKEINLGIWEIQDRFHGRNVGPEEGAAMCRMILEENDRRFRVKAKINVASGSPLREQKGYLGKTAFLNAPRDMASLTALNGAVRYLSTAFDKVLVACCRKDEAEVRLMYKDDPCIEVWEVEDNEDNSPLTAIPVPMRAMGEIAVYSCGFRTEARDAPSPPDLLYDELNLPAEARHLYLHFPDLPSSGIDAVSVESCFDSRGDERRPSES